MTLDDFRALVLEMPDAIEASHMNHPDFRVGGKIFATIPRPTEATGMVVLTPEQQRGFVALDNEAFGPVNGAWGAKGCTLVRLASADESLVRDAIKAAWANKAIAVPAKRKPKRT